MEQALGAPLLIRARHGVTPTQAGRTLLQHARTMLEQAERLREDLGAYAGGLAGQVRVLSNTNALTEFLPEALERVPRRPSQCQRRSRGAAERRDRRADRRGRRRHRHRRRHGRCRAADHLSVPQRPLRAGGGARPSAGEKIQDRLRRGARPRFRRPRPRQRHPALPRQQGDQHRPAAPAARAVAQLRRGLPAGRVQCRRRRRAGDHRAPRGQKHGDQGGRSRRSLGAARSHDLHPRLRGAAALCAPAGRAHAGRR